MKILMFGWEYPPAITGGLGTACYGLSQALAPLVEKITFVLPKVKKAVASGGVELLDASTVRASSIRMEFDDILETIAIDSNLQPYFNEIEYLEQVVPHGRERREFVGGASSQNFSGDYGGDLLAEVSRYSMVAAQIALRDDYDVIHAHDWMTFPAGIRAQQMTGIPLVAHVHALEYDRSGEHVNEKIFQIERLGMEQAQLVVAVSQRTKELIIEKYGITAEKIAVLYNGVQALAPHEQVRTEKHLPNPLVAFLGRMTLQKGPEYFLEAAYLVARKFPDIRFVMAGDGDMFQRMVKRMAELRLTKHFHFTGFVNEQKRHQLLSTADLFVMPSVSEPFGISPLEALRHDVPVIVSKQSGVAEVLHHALKVDFWDVRKTADCIIHILTQKALARQLIEGSRQDLSLLNWDRSASRLLDIYKELA
ncbi:MAG: glycosyltransferase family 4 protein [Oligoflexus sp.]